MEITEITKENAALLESIKSSVWPSADMEHYGDQQPNFYKKEFTLAIKEDGEIIGYASVIIDTGVAQIEPSLKKVK